MSIIEKLTRILKWISNLVLCNKRICEKDFRIKQLEHELETYQKQIDYSFIPVDWIKVKDRDVVTNKTFQNGIPLEWDIRDLLNSTVYSRKLADEVLSEIGNRKASENLDTYFNRLILSAANKTVVHIQYVTNSEQFNTADLWNNGDTAIVTKKGDCDLSVRVFVRVCNDTLDKLKMFEYKKYIFQAIGYMATTGHSWGIYFDPVDEVFRMVEATRDIKYTIQLPEIMTAYKLYFCLNFKHIFYKNREWRIFL